MSTFNLFLKPKHIIRARIYLILGWAAAIGSIFFMPVVLGVSGIVFGVLAKKNGSRFGVAVIMASVFFMSVGILLGNVLQPYLKLIISTFLSE